jgi:G3E family GTPase
LINTLDTLLEKRKDIEYILVETNGLADPGSVIASFWLDEGLGSKVELHQAIVVVDAVNFSKKLEN